MDANWTQNKREGLTLACKSLWFIQARQESNLQPPVLEFRPEGPVRDTDAPRSRYRQPIVASPRWQGTTVNSKTIQEPIHETRVGCSLGDGVAQRKVGNGVTPSSRSRPLPLPHQEWEAVGR
jgi:hypothetical protein